MNIKTLILSTIFCLGAACGVQAADASLFMDNPMMYSPDLSYVAEQHNNTQDRQISQDNQQIQISVKENAICISGANGQVARVYNLTGVCVATVRIEGQDKHIELGLRGYYIVKVGDTVRKVYLK